jgi:aminopeptidase N
MYDVLEYKLDLDLYSNFISPYTKSFSGSATIHIRVDSILNHIDLNAGNYSLQIDSVGLSGLYFEHHDDTLRVDLDNIYYPGDSLYVKIFYKHKNVTDYSFFASSGMVFTDCEPQRARNWFPCWDQPTDKARLDLTAKVPATAKLGSNGRLADSTHIADTIWYHWISKDPVATYLIVMAGRNNYNLDIVYWPRISNPQDTLPIRFYYNPGENPTPIKNMIGSLADFFAQTYCDHPFEKNGFATLNNQFQWVGMENQTLTCLCPNCWNEMLIVHEFSHQWFGDMITCGTWADLWLNEGFANYSEALWLEEKYGLGGYKDEIESNAGSYLNGNPGWPIYNPSWAFNPPGDNILFNYAITYAKSACVLHLFRYVVGDPLFFECIHQYADDSVNFRYQSVVTQDFIAKMNEVTGEDYSWFFDQWLMYPNHPVYSNTYNFTKVSDKRWDVWFRASQMQSAEHFFTMPLELKIGFSDGSDTLVNLFNSFNEQEFMFGFAKEPVSLVFDPDNQIVLKQATTVVGTDKRPMRSKRLEYTLHPNPFDQSARLTVNLPEEGRLIVTLRDRNGQLVTVLMNENKPTGECILTVGRQGLPSGIYLLNMEFGEASATAKLMIR